MRASARRAERDLAPYLHHRRTGRAFVVAKVAMSLDGRVAAADGTSHWITSEARRADAHELRADSQAIVVGAGTALADQPALTVRGVDVPPRRRCASCSTRGQRARGRSAVRRRARADAGRHDRRAHAAAVDAWRAAGAKVETVAPAPTAHGADAASRSSAAKACCRRWSRAAARCSGTRRRRSRAAPRRVRRAHAARHRGRAGVRVPGPAPIDDAPRFELVDVTRVGPDVRLEYEVAA